MAEKENTLIRRATLRQVAKKAALGNNVDFKQFSPEDVAYVMHELGVYQIELETQNEELLAARAILEETKEKYAMLFDFAPVGYFTQGQDARIREINMTLCDLLGLTRKELLGVSFSTFIAEESILPYDLHTRKAEAAPGKTTCEVEINAAGERKCVQLASIPLRTPGRDALLLTAVNDITPRKREAEKLKTLESA